MPAPSKLNGIHHITCITADAAANVDFYTRVLGLRLTAKSVNQDDPTVYHLFYGDENARPGIDLTFFEYKHAIQGRPGPGEIHRIVWRVASPEAIKFWDERLRAEGVPTLLEEHNLRFSDGEGLQHELIVDSSADQPLVAVHPDIPADLAVQGFEGVRAYSYNPENSVYLLKELMGAQEITVGETTAWELRGDTRGGWIAFDPAPPELGRQGAGSVHHIAWATRDADLQNWIDYVTANRIPSSGYVDRHYFHSLYYREPGGILYELATDEPGFTVDGLSIEELGSKVILPPRYEPAREMIEAQLTPLPDPRADWPAGGKPAAD
jgi:glyoxalase family protein